MAGSDRNGTHGTGGRVGPRQGSRQGLVGPFTGRQILTALAVVGIVALFLVAVTTPLGDTSTRPSPQPQATPYLVGEPTEGLQPGQRAPELQGETPDGQTVGLVDLDGRPIRLADLRGRPVWINFWASWCPPCQTETPVLRDAYERHRDEGLALVAISVQETSPEDVRRYVEQYGLSYQVGFDATSAVFKRYQAFALPTQVFIDRDGIVRQVVNGPLTREQAEEILAGIISRPRRTMVGRPLRVTDRAAVDPRGSGLSRLLAIGVFLARCGALPPPDRPATGAVAVGAPATIFDDSGPLARITVEEIQPRRNPCCHSVPTRAISRS